MGHQDECNPELLLQSFGFVRMTWQLTFLDPGLFEMFGAQNFYLPCVVRLGFCKANITCVFLKTLQGDRDRGLPLSAHVGRQDAGRPCVHVGPVPRPVGDPAAPHALILHRRRVRLLCHARRHVAPPVCGWADCCLSGDGLRARKKTLVLLFFNSVDFC